VRFLKDPRQKPDEAEKYYRRAVNAYPKNAWILASYANFLKTVRQNGAEAERYYRGAIEADLKAAGILGNLSQLLFEDGRTDEGLKHLVEALAAMNPNETLGLPVELMFYGYAHGPAAERSGYLSQLKRLLENGTRSSGWNFSRNVERATKIEKHPAKSWLAKLAAVCNDSANITSLNRWKAWREA
jgi:tetratricopeptide (TPR) repeat protein